MKKHFFSLLILFSIPTLLATGRHLQPKESNTATDVGVDREEFYAELDMLQEQATNNLNEIKKCQKDLENGLRSDAEFFKRMIIIIDTANATRAKSNKH